MRAKLQAFFQTYGWLGLGVWYAIFGTTILLVAALVHMGVSLDRFGETIASSGPWLAGYAVAKVLMAPRLALTVLVTTFLSRRFKRVVVETSG